MLTNVKKLVGVKGCAYYCVMKQTNNTMLTVSTIEEAYNIGDTLKPYDVVKVANDYDVIEALDTAVFHQDGKECLMNIEVYGCFAVVGYASEF